MDHEEANGMKKTSILDLPNELIVELFKYLDLPNRFKFRVNRRLDRLQLLAPMGINRVDFILIGKPSKQMEISVALSSRCYYIRMDQTAAAFTSRAEPFLLRLSRNCQVDKITMLMGYISRKLINCIIKIVSYFDTKLLSLHSPVNLRGCQDILPHVLALAQKNINIHIKYNCNIRAEELCRLHQAMLADDCKLESVEIKLYYTTVILFMEKCFKVVVTDDILARSVKLDCEDDSIELYTQNGLQLIHFKGDLRSTINQDYLYPKITFSKDGSNTIKPSQTHRAKMNHLYLR